eukprot:GHVT01085207.1.p2 GENE.GHVT01085207.1~~GHVT01085207.1.p2  ORF type:complete len:110 (-),score=13.26 GHVT01085207.1:179-508(-)
MSVRQTVNLDSYLLGEYDFHDEEDRKLVDGAIQEGIMNPATYKILENGLCLDPHQMAESQVQDSCPFLTATEGSRLELQSAENLVPTPPIALEVEIGGNDADTEATPSP